MKRAICLCAASVFVVGCGAEGPSEDTVLGKSGSNLNVDRPKEKEDGDQPKFLPLGVPVPVGVEPDGIPEPPDPVKYGPLRAVELVADALPATAAEMPTDPARANAVPTKRGLPPDPPPSHEYAGIRINANSMYGSYGYHDVHTTLEIDDGDDAADWLYAPTNMPASYACIEATTYYRTYYGNTVRYSTWYNWCDSPVGFQSSESLTNSTWQSKYMRTVGGRDIYISSVYKYDPYENCWAGVLYNWNTASWDTKLTSCGTGSHGHSHGWSMFEYWYFYGCPDLPDVKDQNLYYLDNSGWHPFSTSMSTEYALTACFQDPSGYDVTVAANHTWWLVENDD